MTEAEKQRTLQIACNCFERIAARFETKLRSISINDFNLNPFSHDYLAYVAFGNNDPDM